MSTTKVDQFTHLHTHSHYSALDGFDTIDELVGEVERLGQPAISVTDHGTLAGVYDLYKKASAKGITPIAGIEFYVVPSIGNRFSREPLYLGDGSRDDVSGRGAYTHLTVLAENNVGLKNLFRLNLLASTEGYYQKPRVDLELLEEYSEGLIATTGCPSGEIQTWIRLGRPDKALEYAARLVDIFGRGNVFLELMDHGMKGDLERKVRSELLNIGRKLDLPLLATNDLHYAKASDAKAHEHMLAIQTRSVMSELPDHEGGKRFAFEGGSYYVKSAAEMAAVFPDHPEALKNTMVIAERASFSVEPDDSLRPRIDIPEGYTEAGWLTKEAFDGLARRLPDKVTDPEYIDRLKTELEVLNSKGYSGYFLVVSDFVRWGKFVAQPPVPTGHGRGSAAGSLVAFCLDITDADPIRFDLLFERFINPERDSPPDIDMDFNDTDRERVVEYVRQKYGDEYVALVTTLGTMKAKSAIKDMVRILEHPFALGNDLTKAMPEPVFGKEAALWAMFDPEGPRYDEGGPFRDKVRETGSQEIIKSAIELEGRIRSYGVHAAAVVISSEPVVETVPVYMRQADKVKITQWDYPTAEEIGLLKVDFLGLRNLGVIAEAIKHVKRTRGIDIDLQDLILGPMDDKKTYELLSRGESLGVFQLDGGGMRSLMKMLKPTQFEDISALLSLYRPGPMGVNAHTDFALRKNGLQEVTPIHPELAEPLKDILGETYQLCVAGDTLITDATTGERIRMDELGDRVASGNFYTFGVNDKGQAVRERVSHWWESGEKKILKVTTSTGQVLRVSETHPVFTMDGWKNAGDLTTNDKLASPRNAMIASDTSEGLTVPEARFLGYMIGDGHINPKGNTFINSDPLLREHVIGLASQLFPDVYTHEHFRKEGKKGTPHVSFQTTPFGKMIGHTSLASLSITKWFEALGYGQKTLSADKFIPSQVFGSSRESILNFIAGLWDTDGHVGTKFTFLRTISATLAKDTQNLLSRLGYQSYLSKGAEYISVARGVQVPYAVHVYDPRFWDEVVPLLVSAGKASAVKSVLSGTPRSRGIRTDFMLETMVKHVNRDPSVSVAIRARYLSKGATTLDSVVNYIERNHFSAKVKGLSRNKLPGNWTPMNALADVYLQNYATDRDQIYAEMDWTQVKSIEEDGIETVYDMTVENVHNFLVDGLLAKNCIYQEQVMRIAQKVAGYSLAQADLLRRAMGKKKRYIIDAEFVPFSAGMKQNGYSDDAIKTLWDILVPFSDYAFNKCITGDALVALKDGSRISISDLYSAWSTSKGEYELAAVANGVFTHDTVVQVFKNGVKPVFEMVLANGFSVKSTEDHRHLTLDGWKELKDINVGELIATNSGDTVDISYVAVASIKEAGQEMTYDIEMAGAEHNYVANGIVTHNSHTVGYGLISYATAFLKAHYPAEYMAALLSSVTEKKDKTTEYLEECRRMGLKVSVPDVNKADVDYAPVSESEITFGFKAIRGVGEGVAAHLVAERAASGPFKSFGDFLERADKTTGNKRVIEGLTHGGAFDSLGLSRRAIIEGLPFALDTLRKRSKAKPKNEDQVSLFDDMFLEVEPISLPPMPEYPRLDKLKVEREYLGLYLSGHPLEGLDLSRASDSKRIVDFLGEDPVIKPVEGWGNGKSYAITGIVTSLSVRRTRKGDMMATGVIEDKSGSIEFTVFPKAFVSVGSFLKLDGVFTLFGYSKAREEELSFLVDSLRPEEFSASGGNALRVKVTELQWRASRPAFERLLARHQAPAGTELADVIVSIRDTDHNISEEVLSVPVQVSDNLVREVRGLYGNLAIGRWVQRSAKPEEPGVDAGDEW